MGYHPGAEDDGVYLAAVHSAVQPDLYPHDSAFFQMQMRTSLFDNWMASFVHATGLSVAGSELLFQFISLLLMMWAGWAILSHLFESRAARWGGLALFSAMLTLPVAGTALYLADQYLHPRNPATALILFAIAGTMSRRLWQALPLLCIAFVLHPLMGAFGFSFCFFLALTLSKPVRQQILSWRARLIPTPAQAAPPIAALVPFGWVFDRPSQSYLEAIKTRHCYHLFEWTWYEWLGALAPLLIFWALTRLAKRQKNIRLYHFSLAIFVYATFHQFLALVLLTPRSMIALSTLEPMRYLQLVYVFLTLLGGAYIGQHLLRASTLRWTAFRWAAFLLLANGGMLYAQRQLFASTPHIELPGRSSQNSWLQAFQWIRINTPRDAYFAADPHYMSAPGEDNHGFRALAQRSILADAVKDTAVITKAPDLGPVWEKQVAAQDGWQHFALADFHRLHNDFGVDWVLVTYPGAAGLACPWHNAQLAVCKIP